MSDKHRVHFFGPIGIYTVKGPDYHSVLLTVENENDVNDAVELIVSEEDGVTLTLCEFKANERMIDDSMD